ncbi:hypothetical protein XENOCAPTIV_019183 [Xenoophorus captivus]|uniref:Uncharacterized protein n=1 Tax=Xenoophorus captivus TaxID=1517983 RepID=A0ABV0Q3U8_9TELE
MLHGFVTSRTCWIWVRPNSGISGMFLCSKRLTKNKAVQCNRMTQQTEKNSSWNLRISPENRTHMFLADVCTPSSFGDKNNSGNTVGQQGSTPEGKQRKHIPGSKTSLQSVC